MKVDLAKVDPVIYALVDPRTKDIRYVGKSWLGTKRSREPHYGSCGSWIESLQRAELMPQVEILQTLPTDTNESSLSAAEVYWIARGRQLGWPLTNLTDGGGGTCYRSSTWRTQISFFVPRSFHRALKIEAAERDMTLAEVIVEAITRRETIQKEGP